MTISGGVVEVSVEEIFQKMKIKPRKRFEIPLGCPSESKVSPASNHLTFLSLSCSRNFFYKNKIKRLLKDLKNRKWRILNSQEMQDTKHGADFQTKCKQYPTLFCTSPSQVHPLDPSLFPKDLPCNRCEKKFFREKEDIVGQKLRST